MFYQFTAELGTRHIFVKTVLYRCIKLHYSVFLHFSPRHHRFALCVILFQLHHKNNLRIINFQLLKLASMPIHTHSLLPPLLTVNLHPSS